VIVHPGLFAQGLAILVIGLLIGFGSSRVVRRSIAHRHSSRLTFLALFGLLLALGVSILGLLAVLASTSENLGR